VLYVVFYYLLKSYKKNHCTVLYPTIRAQRPKAGRNSASRLWGRTWDALPFLSFHTQRGRQSGIHTNIIVRVA